MDIEVLSMPDKHTPLMACAFYGKCETAKLLLDRGANIEVLLGDFYAISQFSKINE